jgi:hypothetical protein
MNKGNTVFTQVLDFFSMHQFRRCVDRYLDNCRLRSFTGHDQYFCKSFAKLTYRKSLRDIDRWLRVCYQTVVLTGYNSGGDYPRKLCRILYFDKRKAPKLAFLTNHFVLSARTIADSCRYRGG